MRRRTNQALSHEQVRFLASHQASSVTVGVLSLRVCVLSRGLCAGWINLGFELPIGGLDWQIWGSVRNKLWPQCPFGKHDFLPMFCRWYLGYVVDKFVFHCLGLEQSVQTFLPTGLRRWTQKKGSRTWLSIFRFAALFSATHTSPDDSSWAIDLDKTCIYTYRFMRHSCRRIKNTYQCILHI